MVHSWIKSASLTASFIESTNLSLFKLIFFGGVQLLALGLIGEYLGRTYLLSNNHPQFSIKESKNIKFKD